MSNNILWLIRCTSYRYAKDFIDEGTIKFNTPHNWIEYEKSEGKGRGDILEGIFASSPTHDFSKRRLFSKVRGNVITEQFNNNFIFRSREILGIPCFSLFVLSDNSFSNNFFIETNKFADTTTLVTQYFNDFSNFKTRDEIDSLEIEQKPVVLFIQSPKKFIDRLKTSLKKLGFKNDEILIDFVQYIDKNQSFLSSLKFPRELLLKDKSFEHQSELRIILNTNNMNVLNKFKNNNYFVKLGNTNEFAIIHDYYLEDMLIEKKGNTLYYNLPKPIITEIDMSSKEEVQKVLGHLIYKKYSSKDQVLEAQNQVKELVDYYYENFSEHIQVPIEFWMLGRK